MKPQHVTSETFTALTRRFENARIEADDRWQYLYVGRTCVAKCELAAVEVSGRG